MTQIPIFVISLTYLAQAAPASAAEPAAPGVEAAAPTVTEADKFVSQAADALDKIEYLSARMLQTIHANGKTIQSTGTVLRGPGNRGRVELRVDIGSDDKALQINSSDGSTCYLYKKFFDTETCETFDVRQVVPLLESRDIPPEIRQQQFLDLPFISVADMLRGYQKTIQFETMSDGSIGDSSPRAVTVVEGIWKADWIPLVAQNPNAKTLDDIPAPVPQHVRLSLDKETSFPLRVELYRKDKEAEYKPIYQLDFLDVRTDKLEDSQFAFAPPEGVTPTDGTAQIVELLNRIPEKPATPPGGAPTDPPPADKQP